MLPKWVLILVLGFLMHSSFLATAQADDDDDPPGPDTPDDVDDDDDDDDDTEDTGKMAQPNDDDEEPQNKSPEMQKYEKRERLSRWRCRRRYGCRNQRYRDRYRRRRPFGSTCPQRCYQFFRRYNYAYRRRGRPRQRNDALVTL